MINGSFVRSIFQAVTLRVAIIIVHVDSDLLEAVFTETGSSEHLSGSMSQLWGQYLKGESSIILISES